MRHRWLISIFFFFSWPAIGQNLPAFRQFYFNPYLYNPAYAGMNDYLEVSVVYRQQWMGFNDSPSASGFALQYPTQNRASLAMNFITQQAVALRTTSAQATFAYRLPITAKQFLFFGISGVAGYNDLNLDGADYSNDPTILSAASTKFYGDANAGLVYQLGNLRVGFALPKLFGQPYFSPKDLVNVRYSQLRNQLYSMNYKFYSGNFSFEPYALYRMNRDLQNWWEGGMIMYFNEEIWTGASFNSTQGLGFFLGMDFKEKFRVGYSYELPPPGGGFISTSSHEIQLKLRLGKKRVFKWASRFEVKDPSEVESFEEDSPIVQDTTKIISPALKVDEPITDTVVNNQEKKLEVEPNAPSEPTNLVVEKEIVPTRPRVQPTLAPGIYVIAGSFNTLDRAQPFITKLTDLGYTDIHVGLSAKNNQQYVYVFSSYDIEECRKMRDQLRLKEATRQAWILRIE